MPLLIYRPSEYLYLPADLQSAYTYRQTFSPAFAYRQTFRQPLLTGRRSLSAIYTPDPGLFADDLPDLLRGDLIIMICVQKSIDLLLNVGNLQPAGADVRQLAGVELRRRELWQSLY